jgi:hypothetical protein
MPLDETEAYLRHRARVHEREKREKLRRQGKLEAYLAEIERNKPKMEAKRDEDEQKDSIDKIMEEYNAIKKLDKENSVVGNLRLENSLEECVEEIVQKKKKVKRRRKKKVAVVEEPSVLLDDAEFKPTMAGSTGLPAFFFNNLVKENKSVFIRARYTCRPKKE